MKIPGYFGHKALLLIAICALLQMANSIPTNHEDDSGSIEIPERPANRQSERRIEPEKPTFLDMASKVARDKNLFDVIGTMLGLVQKTCEATIAKAHQRLRQKEMMKEELVQILKTIDNKLQKD